MNIPKFSVWLGLGLMVIAAIFTIYVRIVDTSYFPSLTNEREIIFFIGIIFWGLGLHYESNSKS